MRDFVIITDSGSDLTMEIVDKFDIKVVPMGLTIDETTYRHYHDYRELSSEDFYAKIRAGKIGTTSCVNVGDAYDEMEQHIKDGKDILYLSFSSGMSGSYKSAMIAAQDLKEKYPNADIRVVDTLCGCIGLGMIVFLAAKKKAEGLSLDEVEQFVEENKLNICHYFTVDDLQYLQKTGRISHLKAIFGSIIGVKPIFVLDNDGKVLNITKARGKKAAMKALCDAACTTSSKQEYFFVVHADAENDANNVKTVLQEQYPNAEVFVSQVGPILGNNVGPGAVALIFYGEKRF